IVALGARAGGRTTPHAVLLVGVVFNALAAAALMLVNALASYTQAQGVLFWIMGSLSTQSYGLIAGVMLYSLVGLGWLGFHAQDLNLLAAGEEGAQQLGVEVERTRRAVFLAPSLHPAARLRVIGANGGGKTTLVRRLSGVLAPRAGSVRFRGAALGAYRRRELARRLAVVPQDPTLEFPFTALEVVLMGRAPHLPAL